MAWATTLPMSGRQASTGSGARRTVSRLPNAAASCLAVLSPTWRMPRANQDVLRPFGGGGFAVFDGLQLGDIQLVNIGKTVQYVGGDECFDLLVAQPGDVHGFAAGEVDKPLRALGLAEHATGAAGDGFACFAFDGTAAHGAGFGQFERFV